MRCIECNCCHKVTRTRYDKNTQKLIKQTFQQCFGVPEPFTIDDVYAECTAYPPEHWKLKQNKQKVETAKYKNNESVVLPLKIGDVYYTKSLIFYDGIDQTGEPKSDIQFKTHKRVIKNRSDIYEYMMLRERGQAFLTEQDANNKIQEKFGKDK